MYKDFGSKVFSVGMGNNSNSEPAAWSKLFNYTNMLKSGAFYKAETLMTILAQKCGTESLIDTTMTDTGSSLKVAFVSTLISVSPPEVYVSGYDEKWRLYWICKRKPYVSFLHCNLLEIQYNL
jgi:hypothetical protein